MIMSDLTVGWSWTVNIVKYLVDCEATYLILLLGKYLVNVTFQF